MANSLPLGLVCSLQPSPSQKLRAVQEIGIPTVQISYDPQWDSPEGVAAIGQALRDTGIEITGLAVSYIGDNYKDVPTVRETVGLVPEATRGERVERLKAASRFAAQLNVPRLTTHIGYIPEDASDARYPALVETVREVCDELATRGQFFALETGQETAPTLRRFIGDVNRANLRVNFDPANMILYGNGEPIPALDLLAPWVDGVHCKDGRAPTEPDKLGREMPLGQGDVDVPRWIEKLLGVGYRGPLTIEREISGDEQKQDILRAKTLLEGCLSST
ncbi:MAG: sugar phosphate isomerase/epimerase [Armatimonadetes bacterium]|nr:sugar phosphate isomerase/epimerase [Armatimonadota bacterium]